MTRRAGTRPGNPRPVQLLHHRITNIDHEGRIGDCSQCGPQVRLAPRSPGILRCWFAKNRSKNISARPYLKYRKDYCEWCGRTNLHYSQIDVDHKNNRHDDDREENLISLDATCHRLKTFLVAASVPESEWMEWRERYGAVPGINSSSISDAADSASSGLSE